MFLFVIYATATHLTYFSCYLFQATEFLGLSPVLRQSGSILLLGFPPTPWGIRPSWVCLVI